MGFSLQSGVGDVLACALSFLAAAIASAGGVGGGSLYVPILSIVGGLGLKTATVISRFMVTGGALANVLCTLLFRRPGAAGEPLIDCDVVVVTQPCLLLGVGVGVACNVVFPEWLVAALFAVFLAFATLKTYGAGVRRWRTETAAMGRAPDGGCAEDGTKEAPLLDRSVGRGRQCQWTDMAVHGIARAAVYAATCFVRRSSGWSPWRAP
ncbi:hypothetical protein ACP4OV_019885 [Aristida adscensionis]